MYSKGSHTMKLIIGIISIVLCLIILIQSCAAGIGNAIADNGEAGGTGGLILSIFMLISGIIAIAARKSKGGTITSIVFYAVGAVIAFASAGSYKDLIIWGVVSAIFSVLLIISLFMKKKV